MKYSEIFLMAAESISEKNNYSCLQIRKALSRERCYLTPYYYEQQENVFYVELYAENDTTLGHMINVECINGVDTQDLRVMLLCLAAAIAESEGL